MSDFYHPMTKQAASKQYRCINCGEHIERGETYCKQSGVWDGAWFTSHYHCECWNALAEEEDGDFELTPYSGERPARISTSQQGGEA